MAEGNLPGTRPVYQSVIQTASASFEAFYQGTSGRLLRYAYGLTGDMAEAQDFTQEAYVRAWQRWARLRDYDNPESWLRLVVTRLATDRWRWLGVRRHSSPAGGAGSVPGPSDDLVVLVSELKRLPMPQRRALVLHYLLDRPVAEIAEETGVGVNTVKSWLLRGRAALAVNLTVDHSEPTVNAEPALGVDSLPAGDIAAKGRRAQGRRRNTVRGIIGLLTTATAAAAYFLFGHVPQPEPIGPDLVVPYGGKPRVANAVIDEQHAYLSWHALDGTGTAGIFDLTHNRLVGSPIELGRWDSSFGVMGFSEGGAHFRGQTDSEGAKDWALSTIDPKTGKLLWQWRRPPGADETIARVFRQAVVIVQPGRSGHVTALDARTGGPKWTVDEPITETSVRADGQRLALLAPDGVLRVRDVATGNLLSVLSGVPVPPRHYESRYSYLLLEDDLYVSTDRSVSRMALSGEKAEVIAEVGSAFVVGCGSYVCVGETAPIEQRAQVLLLDRSTGREVRRLYVPMVGAPQAAKRGIIFQGGTLTSSVIYDYGGTDISPPDMADRTAQWLGDDQLLLIRQVGPEIGDGPTVPPTAASPSNSVAMRAELSVYSFTTHRETSLGEVVLRGGCDIGPGKVVCPTGKGFTLYH